MDLSILIDNYDCEYRPEFVRSFGYISTVTLVRKRVSITTQLSTTSVAYAGVATYVTGRPSSYKTPSSEVKSSS